MRTMEIEKTADMEIFLLECSNDICRDNQNVRIHSGSHLRIKGDLTDHTGGRKHAQFTRIQAEQRYLSPLLGEKIGADLAGKDEQHSETFVVAAVYERGFIISFMAVSASQFFSSRMAASSSRGFSTFHHQPSLHLRIQETSERNERRTSTIGHY